MAEEQKLPPTTITPGTGNLYRDFIPEEEEWKHPGQGHGNRSADWVPEGLSAADLGYIQENELEGYALEKFIKQRRSEYNKRNWPNDPRNRPNVPKG